MLKCSRQAIMVWLMNSPEQNSFNPLNLLTDEPHHQPAPESKIKTALSSLIIFVVIPILVALFLTAFVIQSYQVDGQSMETTLQNHDRLIVNKLPRTWSRLTGHQFVPKRGSIIVFNQTGLPDSIYQKQLIKRVIGLPGERVAVHDGAITIYNRAYPNGFNPDQTSQYHIDADYTAGDINVSLGPNEIFVCGDNRGNSEDSRYFGPVGLNNVVGQLILRIMPISKSETF
jgi:signal peptidase I